MVATWKELPNVDTVATLSDTDPSAVGTTLSEGVGSAASRYDHVHTIGSGAISNSNMFASKVVLQAAIGDGVVHPAQMTIDAALDLVGHEAQNMVLHQATIGSPPTAVVGKAFMDSATKKVYVCTAV